MRILAFDASVEPGSCALLADGTLREQAVAAGTSSSQGLLPIAAALLDAAGLRWSELDAIAFGSGPGGFTGLRVACGIAQGLAFAHATPVVPVDSLAALAAVALTEHPQCDAVLALLDARMGEVYCAQYRRAAGAPARLGEATVLPPAAVAIAAGESGARLLCAGNALRAYPELAARLAPLSFALRDDLLPTAGSVARLAAQRFAEHGGVPAEQAVPTYVREKVAFTTAERLAQGGKA